MTYENVSKNQNLKDFNIRIHQADPAFHQADFELCRENHPIADGSAFAVEEGGFYYEKKYKSTLYI